MLDVETLVVGGGPAGCACAGELRRRGREVLVLERAREPRCKPCAGWITPQVLRDLELEPGAYPHGLLRLERIRLCLGGTRCALIRPADQLSIRRCEFDEWLLRRCGAPVLHHEARSIALQDGRYVVDGLFRAAYLVGAGGAACPVRRAFFGPPAGTLVVALEAEFAAAPPDPLCTLFFPFPGAAGYGWYVPKAGAVNIGFGGVAGHLRGGLREAWGAFAQVLRRRGLLAAPAPPPRSYAYRVGNRSAPVRLGNVLIVGDAAGLATADLGEGIGPAVASGLLAAREICGADRYAARRLAGYSLGGLSGPLLRLLMRAGAAAA